MSRDSRSRDLPMLSSSLTLPTRDSIASGVGFHRLCVVFALYNATFTKSARKHMTACKNTRSASKWHFSNCIGLSRTCLLLRHRPGELPAFPSIRSHGTRKRPTGATSNKFSNRQHVRQTITSRNILTSSF